MLLEFARFLLVNFPYVICTTLAAFIIWGEGVKKYLNRLIIYALLAALAQSLTMQITIRANLEVVRFIVEIIACYGIACIVFRKPWGWTFKIYATSYMLGYVIVLLYIAVLVGLLHQPYSVTETHVTYWLTIMLPANILGVLGVYLLRRFWIDKRSLISDLKTRFAATPSIYIAIFIQTVLFVGLSGQILMNYLGRSQKEALILLFGLCVIFFLSIYVLMKYTAFSREELADTRDAVAENLMEMLNAVRGQRHDFMNHLQVIYGLNQLEQRDALDEYLADLLREVTSYNEMLKIDNPIIAALIHAKVAQADTRGIDLQVEVKANLKNIATAIDVTRIIGNLIDNAMDAAEVTGELWVNLKIEEKNYMIICSVTNPYNGNAKELKGYLAPGLSSKEHHEGLGLYVCQKLCTKIQAKLEWRCIDKRQVTFILTIPPAGR